MVSEHLKKIKIADIQNTKKLAIFLDDFDYFEPDYMSVLKDFFVSYSASDKAIVILSGRKPLINSIAQDDELRQAFQMDPRQIHLVRLDTRVLIESRIGILTSDETTFERTGKVVTIKTNPSIAKVLRTYTIAHLKKFFDYEGSDEILDKLPRGRLKIDFGFNDLFYTYLSDVTGRNIRDIENLLPRLFEYHIKRRDSALNFNTDFFNSYIECAYEESNYVLDLVSEKTKNRAKRKDQNSILLIVLQYFSQNTAKDDAFYRELAGFGIDRDLANKAIDKLCKSPYSLIDPDFVYGLENKTLLEQYRINTKGKTYLNHIISRRLYYEKLKQTPSARTYLVPERKPRILLSTKPEGGA